MARRKSNSDIFKLIGAIFTALFCILKVFAFMFDNFINIFMKHRRSNENSTDGYEAAKRLIKEATQLKKTNLQAAIKKIDCAIEQARDDASLDWYFKKSYYLYLAGRADEAYSIYRLLLSQLDPEDYYMYNMDVNTIQEKANLQLFREKKYRDFLWFKVDAAWNLLLAFACQGKFNSDTSLHYLFEDKKMQKAASKLNNGDILSILEIEFTKFFEEKKSLLLKLSTIASKRRSHSKYPKQFIDLYDRLDNSWGNEFVIKLNKILAGSASDDAIT